MRICTLLLCLIYPLCGYADKSLRQIVVTGAGVVSVTPDMAVIQLGVTREARTASEAMAGTNDAAARVLAQIEAAGIEARDVQTASINLSLVWDHSNSRPPQVRGYVASNNLTVRVRDLAGLGGLLDALIADGVNTLNGLSFSIAETGLLELEARGKAVRDARAKAETLAEAANVALGQVLQISEGGGQIAPAPMMRGATMEAAVPMAAGEVDVRVSVTVVFGIGD